MIVIHGISQKYQPLYSDRPGMCSGSGIYIYSSLYAGITLLAPCLTGMLLQESVGVNTNEGAVLDISSIYRLG